MLARLAFLALLVCVTSGCRTLATSRHERTLASTIIAGAATYADEALVAEARWLAGQPDDLTTRKTAQCMRDYFHVRGLEREVVDGEREGRRLERALESSAHLAAAVVSRCGDRSTEAADAPDARHIAIRTRIRSLALERWGPQQENLRALQLEAELQAVGQDAADEEWLAVDERLTRLERRITSGTPPVTDSKRGMLLKSIEARRDEFAEGLARVARYRNDPEVQKLERQLATAHGAFSRADRRRQDYREQKWKDCSIVDSESGAQRDRAGCERANRETKYLGADLREIQGNVTELSRALLDLRRSYRVVPQRRK